MTETAAQFVARVDRLEKRFRGDRYQQDVWLMPVDLLVRLRDELVQPSLFPTEERNDESGTVAG